MTQWDDITTSIALALSGEKEAGRSSLLHCWQASAVTEHAQRCVMAHYLADLHPDLAEEVLWDERALSAHRDVADGDLDPIGIPTARGLAPSLHLNLGDGYLRQGRLDDAEEQLRAGLCTQDALADDGYGGLIRRGLCGLSTRISTARAALSE